VIIDCHAHVASTAFLPKSFFDGWVQTMKAGMGPMSESQERRLTDLFDRLCADPDCEQLLAQMDEAGIDQTVLLLIDFGLAFPGAADVQELHLRTRDLMRRHPGRFVGFAGVDPRRGREGLDLFERAVTEWGFQGLKLYPPCGYSPSDPRLFPFYEICARHRLPVLTHVGPTSAALSFQHTRPWDVDDAALKFPGVNFILAHGGVVWHEDAALLARFRPNVFLDVSGFQAELKNGRFPPILRGHLAQGLGRKLLFGSDWPIYRFFGSQAHWVSVLKGYAAEGALSADDLEGLLCRNTQALLPGRSPAAGGPRHGHE